jgi:acyl transferase domain-containing protein
MLETLATAYTLGCDPDWARLSEGRLVPLPDYPRQGERYWAGDHDVSEMPPVTTLPLPEQAQRYRGTAAGPAPGHRSTGNSSRLPWCPGRPPNAPRTLK